jgi:type I restriction enzyme S subunit
MSEEKQPKIRFKGFDDPWEQRKLKNITSKIGSGKTPLGGKKEYEQKNGVLFLRSQNINNNRIDLNNVAYISSKTDEEMISSSINYNDVLLNITGASIGRSAVYRLVRHANVNQHVCIIRLVDGYDSDFLQLFLSSYYGQIQIFRNQAGGGREGLNFFQIGEMTFKFPTLNEQKRFSEFFIDIQNTIAANQSKLEQLKRLKKLLMQKIFNQEWRFKGFTDPWEQRKLGEVKTIKDGTHDSPRYVPKGYPLVTSKNLNDSGLNLSDVSYISESDFDSINKRSKVNVGDIIFGMIGTIGNPVLLDESNFAIKNVALLKNDGPIQNHWLIQYLKSDVFNRLTSEKTAGNTQKFIGLNVIRNLIIDTPSIHEQVIIGSFLKLTDSIIAANQRRLDHLQSLKKYLMQNMFV